MAARKKASKKTVRKTAKKAPKRKVSKKVSVRGTSQLKLLHDIDSKVTRIENNTAWSKPK
jgi:hypothetical protein